MGTLSGSGLIFMVCVGLAFYLVWRRLRRRGRSQWIEAEIYAADVLDQPGPGQRPAAADSGGDAARSSRPSAAPAPAAAASPAGGGLRLRWGRIGLLGFSLLALLASPVLGALALFQGASPVPALICLLLAFAGLACLRALALRDQKRRRTRRAQEESLKVERASSGPPAPDQSHFSATYASPAEASTSEAERDQAPAPQPALTGPLDLNQALERRRNH